MSRRTRRRLLAVGALICAALSFVEFASQSQGANTANSTSAASASASGHTAKAAKTASGVISGTSAPSSEAGLLRSNSALVAVGHKLFQSSCSSCHGFNAEGITGRAPDLHGVGELAPDFYLETGRMPLAAPHDQPLEHEPAFPQSEIKALIAYVGSLGGPPIPTVHPLEGSTSAGQELFALNCAGCHTIQARGGIVTGAVVPWLSEANPTEIAEAIRIGPYVMPRFSTAEITEKDVDSIARYVQTTDHPEDRGGWGLGRLGPIPEGMVAWFLAIGSLVLVARLIGERNPE